MARKLYLRQGMGVGLFRTQYGGRNKVRGVRPERHAKGAGESGGLGPLKKRSFTCAGAKGEGAARIRQGALWESCRMSYQR